MACIGAPRGRSICSRQDSEKRCCKGNQTKGLRWTWTDDQRSTTPDRKYPLSYVCVNRDWNPGRSRRTGLDTFTNRIEEWIAAGGRNAAELFRELQAQGCVAGYDAVRRFVSRRLGSLHRPGPRRVPCVPPPPPRPSAQQLSFEFLKRAEKRQAGEQARMDRLREWPALQEALDLAESFAALVRQQTTASLSDWLAQAEQSGCGEFVGFATGLRQDEAAVRAALTTRWSNGPVEGQVNRLKAIKRQMYGRAGLPLLRARVSTRLERIARSAPGRKESSLCIKSAGEPHPDADYQTSANCVPGSRHIHLISPADHPNQDSVVVHRPSLYDHFPGDRQHNVSLFRRRVQGSSLLRCCGPQTALARQSLGKEERRRNQLETFRRNPVGL